MGAALIQQAAAADPALKLKDSEASVRSASGGGGALCCEACANLPQPIVHTPGWLAGWLALAHGRVRSIRALCLFPSRPL
jgi:hypothetical protein